MEEKVFPFANFYAFSMSQSISSSNVRAIIIKLKTCFDPRWPRFRCLLLDKQSSYRREGEREREKEKERRTFCKYPTNKATGACLNSFSDMCETIPLLEWKLF